MTIKEMNDKIQEYCTSKDIEYCEDCPLGEICVKIFGDYGEKHPDETKSAYEILVNASKETTEHDNVNHPKHYCRDGGMECIDEMLLIFGRSAVMAYCLLNSWKYRYRAADKNGEEDLHKSDWYIRKYKELKEEVDSE